MTATGLSQTLLQRHAPPSDMSVIEASVHRPKRGTRWVATYRDGSGRQFWKSTGHTDRQAALVIAQELERAARRQRADQPNSTGEQIVRRQRGTGRTATGLTQKEVALWLGMTERGVRAAERRGLEKLRRHPALRALWREWAGDIGEGNASTNDVELTDAEVAAVFGLAQTWAERQALEKLMALIAA